MRRPLALAASLAILSIALPLSAQDASSTDDVADKKEAVRALAEERDTNAARDSAAPLPDGVSPDGASPDGALPEGVLAVVNGRPISTLAVDNVVRQLSGEGEQPDRDQILDELIDLEILTQEAEKLDLDKRAEVAASLQLQYTQTMANAYLAETGDAMAFSEDELRGEYDRQTANLDAEEIRASHILTDSETAAASVIAELETGADFATLAAERSIDPAGANGGDLGWFVPASMEPAFAKALAGMQPGDTSSTPVQTEFGYHVIRLVERRGAALPDYDTVKPGLTNLLLRDRLATKVESLRETAEIQR